MRRMEFCIKTFSVSVVSKKKIITMKLQNSTYFLSFKQKFNIREARLVNSVQAQGIPSERESFTLFSLNSGLETILI